MAVVIDEVEYRLTKEYNFQRDEFVIGVDLSDRLIWTRENIINKEEQYYYPAQDDQQPVFMQTEELGLSITASQTPDALKPVAVGLSKPGRDAFHEERKQGHVVPTPETVELYGHQQPYVSGVVTTRDGLEAFSQLFGLWEVRCRLPNARGAWPALWLLPTHKSWPPGIGILSEIDFMEAVSDMLQGVYHASMHTNESGKLVSDGTPIPTGADLHNEFHTYGLAWHDDFIVWFFDGREVKRRVTPEDMKKHPRHLLMNLALGGSWAGDVVAEDYPASFDIKWAKVYYAIPAQKTADDGDDVVRILQDGRKVTKTHVNLVTEYLIELNDEIPQKTDWLDK